jgi:hypothetical protein
MTKANESVSSTSRRRAFVRRLAGVGAASFAAVLVAAPITHAVGAPTPQSDTSPDTGPPNADAPSTDAPSSSVAEPSPPAPSAPAPAAGRPAPAATVFDEAPTPSDDPGEPEFGFQKLRVAVRLAPGAAAPDGHSLANATMQIDETGPGVGADGLVRTCVTDTTGFCPDSFAGFGFVPAAAENGGTPVQPDGQPSTDMTLRPGDSAVITQLTAPDGPGLRVDPRARNVAPCEITADVIVPANIPVCGLIQPVFVPATADASGKQPQEITPFSPPTCQSGEITCTTVMFDDPGLPPTAVNDHAAVKAGKAVHIHVSANDVLKNVPITKLTFTGPTHGTVHRSGQVLTYTAGPTFGGIATFTYTVSTANGSSTATVKVTVTAPPVAADDTAQTTGGSGAPGTPITIPVLDNDKAEGAVITLASTTTPGHGTAAVDGLSIVYTPAAGFVGTDSFTYTITTASGSDTGTITMTVAAPAATPHALANTGAASGQLIGLGATLLVVGGGATVAGRRRASP